MDKPHTARLGEQTSWQQAKAVLALRPSSVLGLTGEAQQAVAAQEQQCLQFVKLPPRVALEEMRHYRAELERVLLAHTELEEDAVLAVLDPWWQAIAPSQARMPGRG